MQEWKMQEQTAGVENAGVENTGATKYGKPSEEENTLKSPDEISASMPAFVGESKFRIIICLHFLDIYSITIDSVSDVSRVTRGLAIRRAKKRVNLTNDKRIKICIADI